MRASLLVAAGLVLPAGLLLLLQPGPALRLDTDGGDAWAWAQEIAGEATGCAAVVVSGPGGVVETPAGRFEVVVPLVPGVNDLAVRCGAAEATQRWHARLAPDPAPPRRIDRDWRDAIVYGVVPFFFGEGRCRDVQAHLDRLDALGVDALWLSPVAAAAPGDFGYAAVDHHPLRDSLEAEEELGALVDEAHARGMAVFLDLAVNHSSDQHRYFRSAVSDPRSPYRSFYERAEDGAHTWYFDWKNLPNLSFDEPEVRAMVLDAFAWWVERFEVDGFRLDAVWGVQRRAPGFPAAVRERLGPDVFLLAEASVRDGVWGE